MALYTKYKKTTAIQRHIALYAKYKPYFLLTICFSAGSVYADVYSWGIQGEPRFSSPVQACDNHWPLVASYFESMGAGYTNVHKVFIYDGNRTALCLLTEDGAATGGNFASAYRLGSECDSGKTYNNTTGACGSDQQKGTPPAESCQGNPINISIGNKYQSESDFQSSGASSLSFTRTYNSLDGIWRHGYSTYLRLAEDKLSIVRADGRETFFTITDAALIPNATERGSLVKNSDGTWTYTTDTNETFVFDTTGRMTNWSSLEGKTLQFAYANSQVTVTDQLGKTLTYTEDAQHQPLTLTAPGTQITYTYDANQHLSKLTKTIGTQTQQRQFLYEDTRNNSLLTGIIDERGIRYATWTYDDQGRAISSEHSGGAEHISVTYNSDGTSTVINELGKSTIYSFVTIDGVKRVTSINGEPSPDCPASNSTYTYNPAGQVLTKTDAKGIITQYTYNPRSLETQRTEDYGSAHPRTTTTEWDPSRFLRTKVVDPSNTTVYTYDAQGRQLTQVTTPDSSQ